MKYRIESDSIGELKVNADAYYGVQTQRAIDNFDISRIKVSDYPEMVKALGMVKLAAARANYDLGLLPKDIFKAMEDAASALSPESSTKSSRLTLYRAEPVHRPI